MSFEYQVEIANYVRANELVDVAGFINMLVCDMRPGSEWHAKLYDDFFNVNMVRNWVSSCLHYNKMGRLYEHLDSLRRLMLRLDAI